MKHTSRLRPGDTLIEAIGKIAGDHPRSIVACSKLVQEAREFDPDAPFQPWGPLYHLDTLGIYGHDVLRLMDVCSDSPLLTLAVLRAVQLGHVSERMVETLMDLRALLSGYNAAEIIRKVRADVPTFGMKHANPSD